MANPTAIADPPCRVCTPNVVSVGAGGAAYTAAPVRRAAIRRASATGADRPPTLSGVASGRAERTSAGAVRVSVGGSTGSPSISSIGVARATLLP